MLVNLLIKKSKKESFMNKLVKLVILVFFISSCGTSKITNTNFSIDPKNAAELIDMVNSENKYHKWLSLRGSANVLHKDKEFRVGININNRQDSVIWISASGPFGIEIIRVQLTPDSIYFINRINKTYFIKPSSHIKDFIKSDLTFYDFQDIITANPRILKKKYKFKANKVGFYLSSTNLSYLITSNYRVQNAKFFDNKTNLELTLEDYQEIDSFPRKIILKFIAEDTFEVTINYSKVEFNTSKKVLFEIPDSYYEIQ